MPLSDETPCHLQVPFHLVLGCVSSSQLCGMCYQGDSDCPRFVFWVLSFSSSASKSESYWGKNWQRVASGSLHVFTHALAHAWYFHSHISRYGITKLLSETWAKVDTGRWIQWYLCVCMHSAHALRQRDRIKWIHASIFLNTVFIAYNRFTFCISFLNKF